MGASWNPDYSRRLASGAIQSDAAHLARKLLWIQFFLLARAVSWPPKPKHRELLSNSTMTIDKNNEIRRETDRKGCRETHNVRRPVLCKDHDGILDSSEEREGGNDPSGLPVPQRRRFDPSKLVPPRDAEGWLLPPSDGRRRSKRLMEKHKAQVKAAIARDIRSWEWFGEQQRAAAAAPLLEAGVHPSNITYVYSDDVQNAYRLTRQWMRP